METKQQQSHESLYAMSQAELAALRLRLRKILDNVGGIPVACRGCGAMVWFLPHRNGKSAPYTEEGLNHFADCPAAAKFKKKENPDA